MVQGTLEGRVWLRRSLLVQVLAQTGRQVRVLRIQVAKGHSVVDKSARGLQVLGLPARGKLARHWVEAAPFGWLLLLAVEFLLRDVLDVVLKLASVYLLAQLGRFLHVLVVQLARQHHAQSFVVGAVARNIKRVLLQHHVCVVNCTHPLELALLHEPRRRLAVDQLVAHFGQARLT